MNTAAETAQVDLTLDCDNAAAELLVVDSEFRMIAHGAPPLRARIEPGIYALKAKIGCHVTERLELLEPRAEPYAFELPAPRFESPMPLDGTATVREDQRDAPAPFMRANGPHILLDQDAEVATSSLVLFIRDPDPVQRSRTPEERDRYARAFQGFELLDADGRTLADFDAQGVGQLEHGYMGAHVRLAPGSYVLAWGHGDDQTCLALNLVKGWTLQVFLRLQPAGEAGELRPNFCDAAFVLDRVDSGYSAAREDLRVMEAARIALVDRRPVAAGQKMRALLAGRCTNPMLNLYGGHLLLLAPRPDFGLLAEVVTSAAAVLGPLHPDVVALAWACQYGTGKRPANFDARPWPEILAAVEGPPLLTPSWDLLLKCVEHGGIHIETLPAFRAAGELAVSGIVLTWEHSRRRFERRLQRRGDGRDSIEPPPAAAASPASMPAAVPSKKRSVSTIGVRDSLAALARTVWKTVMEKTGAIDLSRSTTATGTGLPDLAASRPGSLALGTRHIDSPDAAAEAMRLLAQKVPWAELVRMVQKEPELLDTLASFSPLQRDLVTTLARASDEPEVLEAIDGQHVSSIMRAHRVPLTTLARSLRALDLLAVSTEVVRRLRAVLHASSRNSTPAVR